MQTSNIKIQEFPKENLTKIWFLKSIIIAIITTIVAASFTWVYEAHKTSQIQSASVSIFYYDMSDSLSMIEDKTMKGVFTNQFSLMDKNRFYDYLLSIRGDVSEGDFQNTKVYYRNLWSLESIREEYWSSRDPIVIKSLEAQYNQMKDELGALYKSDSQGFKNTINDLKKIGKIQGQ
ncbi:hypothetical protein K2F43_06165 [Clostridium estertheticum]|uniref:hypothetical protein n=1 Tax=Clostridium estertheticum TaxID=238834 RepID=UPI001C6E32E6|nr:hypothetical protein [Clostridium estertheticum]MBW9170791.1 hypothetical protein [Clostridium estertheticum]WLC74370.1 hypothetical protein KTC99_16590 [Clostridium estertheticum]